MLDSSCSVGCSDMFFAHLILTAIGRRPSRMAIWHAVTKADYLSCFGQLTWLRQDYCAATEPPDTVHRRCTLFSGSDPNYRHRHYTDRRRRRRIHARAPCRASISLSLSLSSLASARALHHVGVGSDHPKSCRRQI